MKKYSAELELENNGAKKFWKIETVLSWNRLKKYSNKNSGILRKLSADLDLKLWDFGKLEKTALN